MKRLHACLYLLLTVSSLSAQDSTLPSGKQAGNYIAAVRHKSDAIADVLDKQTQRYLDRLQKQESKLKAKLAETDSLAAHNVFAGSAAAYTQLRSKLHAKAGAIGRATGLYLPWNDSATSSLKFLSTAAVGGNIPVNIAAINEALSSVKKATDQLRDAENVKAFIQARKAYLTEQLKKYNLSGDLKKYQATGYYYTQQVADYKTVLSDPSKAEQKALNLLRRYPPFQAFMQQHGALAGLFTVPPGNGLASIDGLQSIEQVRQLLQAHVSNMGPTGMAAAQASFSAAQNALAGLRNRINGQSDPADLKDFKHKAVKTATFKKRLVYGMNMQTTRSNQIIPAYSDIGLSLGYRITDRSTAGIGLSYKLGFGSDIRHIRLSSEGLSLRSYLDWQFKKHFFFTGGAEINYLSAFESIKALQTYSAWQASALMGISKTVQLRSKHLSNTKVSLLYDFLHARQNPRGQALVFRAGYLFH